MLRRPFPRRVSNPRGRSPPRRRQLFLRSRLGIPRRSQPPRSNQRAPRLQLRPPLPTELQMIPHLAPVAPGTECVPGSWVSAPLSCHPERAFRAKDLNLCVLPQSQIPPVGGPDSCAPCPQGPSAAPVAPGTESEPGPWVYAPLSCHPERAFRAKDLNLCVLPQSQIPPVGGPDSCAPCPQGPSAAPVAPGTECVPGSWVSAPLSCHPERAFRAKDLNLCVLPQSQIPPVGGPDSCAPCPQGPSAAPVAPGTECV